jgi:hypothetical protein
MILRIGGNTCSQPYIVVLARPLGMRTALLTITARLSGAGGGTDMCGWIDAVAGQKSSVRSLDDRTHSFPAGDAPGAGGLRSGDAAVEGRVFAEVQRRLCPPFETVDIVIDDIAHHPFDGLPLTDQPVRGLLNSWLLSTFSAEGNDVLWSDANRRQTGSHALHVYSHLLNWGQKNCYL